MAAPTPQRPSLRSVVPDDEWVTVRRIAIVGFAILYIGWFFREGLILDRISVGISVFLFLIVAHIGRPLRRWAWLLVDCLCYSAMWFCYEASRGWADQAGFPLQINAARNIDRFLFFGADPNVWMQRHFFDIYAVRWYDRVGSIVYFSHFVVPVIALAVLWATSRREWLRFMKRLASVLLVACAMFVVLPTAPPWLASTQYQAIGHLVRPTPRGFIDLGLKGFANRWEGALDWANAVAAMPSLHASFALFVPAFFLPRITPTWVKVVALCYPIMMLTSLVYFGEHWVIDGLVGWALVGFSFLFWDWFERRQRTMRAERARSFLASTAASE